MRVLLAGLIAAALLGGGNRVFGQDAGLFDRLDANQDGSVTKDEVTDERGKRLFERLIQTADENDDDKLSKEEFQAGLRERRREAPADGQPPRRGPRPDGQRPAGPPDFPRPDTRMAEELFKRWDANEDGKLTVEEVPADRREQFERLLRRIDGEDKSMSKEQFGRVGMGLMVGGGQPPFGPGMMPMAILRALDGDRDGELSKEEIENASQSLATLDKNEDGKLSREELMPPGMGRFPGGPPPGAPGAGPRRGEGRPDGNRPDDARRGPVNAEAFARRLKEADANGDGKLSKEEAPERMKENFDRIDANEDGFVDETELRAMFQRMRENAERGRPEGDRPGRERPERDRPERERPPAESDEKEKEGE